MSDVWGAVGRGISGGVQAYLTGKRRQEEEERYGAAESMEKERLALAQFQARTGMERYEDETALAEQLRAEERHGAYDPRSTEPGIHISLYREISPGAFVPRSREELDSLYMEQRTAEEERQAGLADVAFGREKELIKYRHEQSWPPAYAADTERREPSFFINGEINPLDAFDWLQGWIERKQGDPRANPQLLEIFLNDIELMYGRTVPGAREKAELWLLQQSPSTAQPPPGGGERGPGFFQRAFAEDRAIEAERTRERAAREKEAIMQRLRAAGTPEAMIPSLANEEYERGEQYQPPPFGLQPATVRGAPPMPTPEEEEERRKRGQFNIFDLSKMRF